MWLEEVSMSRLLPENWSNTFKKQQQQKTLKWIINHLCVREVIMFL